MAQIVDLLGLAGNPDFEGCLRGYKAAMGEQLLFSDLVWKTNKRGRRQKRAFVITSQAMYNFAPNKYSTPKRRILFSEVTQVVTVWGSKLEFVIVGKSDWTYNLACGRREELIHTMAITYQQLMNRRLLIVDENEGDATLKLTQTQAASRINPNAPAALALAGDSDDDDIDADEDMIAMQDRISVDAAAAAKATDDPFPDDESTRSSILTDAAYVVAQFRERLTAVRSGSFVAVGNQYLDDEVHYQGRVKPFIVLYRAIRDALPQLEDLEHADDPDSKWAGEDDEGVQFELMYPQKVREVLNNWPHETALECSEAIAELLLNPEINAFVLAKVFSSNELFTVAKMISATLLRHKLEEVRVWALKNLWTLCNHEENSARGHLAETFVELVIPFTLGISMSEGVYEAFLELMTGQISWPSSKKQEGVDVFGKEVKNQEILPLLMELMASANLALQHRLLKDMNLFLLHKRSNIEVFFEFPGWHLWIFPLIAKIPRELPNRNELQDEMFRYAVHVYSIIFTEVFVSKPLQARLQERTSIGAARATSHPLRTALCEMMEALDGWSGWGIDTVNFARSILVATINKVKTRTSANVWKHDFEKQEWMSLIALMFVVRDFMFFFPVIDDDATLEQPKSKDSPDPAQMLPRERDVDQLLRKAHEDHVARPFVPDDTKLGLHLDPRQGVMEDLGLAKKALELLDNLNLKHDDSGNTVLDDPTASKLAKDTYKRAISLRQGMYECVKLFEDLHGGGEAKEEVLFKVCKHLGEAGHIADSDTMSGNVGTFLLDVVRNAVGSKTKTLKMARRLKQSMEKHSNTRSVRLQQNLLADIAIALGPTSREAQRLAPSDAAIPEDEELLEGRPTVVTDEDLVMKIARVGRTSVQVDDILQANLDGMDRTAAQRRKLAEIAPAEDVTSQLEAMVLVEEVEVGIIECCHCGSQIHGGAHNAVCAIGGYWHVHCFNCTECGCELTKDEAGRFFEYNRKPYCAKDFLKQFAPHLCGGCFKPFDEGDDLIESCGRKWHVEHFLCRECGCCLQDRGAFKIMEEEQYCVDCFELYVARCPACRGAVGDDAIIAFKRAWHTGCFACIQCATPLLNSEFFGGDSHDGRGRLPYCRQHFVETFMPKCTGCHNAVEGGVVACGTPWHLECLRCQRCSKPFNNSQFYERRGQPVCEGCYQEQFEGTCPFCCEPLSGSIVEACEEQFYHTRCFVCTTCNAPFTDERFFLGPDRRPYCAEHFEQTFCEVCAGCGLFITDGMAATVADQPWHHQCVQCRDCRRNLMNDEIFLDESDGSLLCREHYSRTASKPCNRCKTHISAEMVTAGQFHFHPECFLCDVCGEPLHNRKVFQEGGFLLCEADFKKRVAQTCKACQQPISDKFTKIAGSTYHPDCVRCTKCQISLRKPAPKKGAAPPPEGEAKSPGGMFAYKGNLYCGGCVQEAKSSA